MSLDEGPAAEPATVGRAINLLRCARLNPPGHVRRDGAGFAGKWLQTGHFVSKGIQNA